MRQVDGNILISATDLMRFMGCAHATSLDLMHLRGEGPGPGADGEDVALLQKQGDAHEAAQLERLKATRRNVVEIARGNHALADRLTLHPDWPLDAKVIAEAPCDAIAAQCGPRAYRAVDDLLSRAAPRLSTGPSADLLGGRDPVAGTLRLSER